MLIGPSERYRLCNGIERGLSGFVYVSVLKDLKATTAQTRLWMEINARLAHLR